MLTVKRKLRILDFDIENRPLSYWTPDRPTAEITAIASCWHGDLSSMQVLLLGRETAEDLLLGFLGRYSEADMVTGHYIRKHDLPMINGSLMEYGFKQLSPKLTCDTRLDMRTKGDVPATQEFLGDILGVSIDKVHMRQNDWREANRLLPEGLKKTDKRVRTDVLQHMLIRDEMIRRNLLRSPKMWG